MDIGTAKPTIEERKEVPHHFIDVYEPDEYFSAGEYSRLARKIILEIIQRGHVPIVVGGSGLYIKAVVDGVFQDDYKDLAVRNRLKEEVNEKGMDALYQRLTQIDPNMAEKIHLNDKKRIIRALEVYELSGIPISEIQKEKTIPANFQSVLIGLRWPREVLYHRIDQRVESMIHSGLIQEVKDLIHRGYGPELNSMNSVGYNEMISYFNGTTGFKEAVELIKRNTRRYAKRQMTWFNKDNRIKWIDLAEPINWLTISKIILNLFKEIDN